VQHISAFESSLARALCWAAAWDMVRDGELAARNYLALVLTGLPNERDINLVTATLRQATGTLSYYAEPTWAPQGWADLARTAKSALLAAQPGSGFQLAWARSFATAARSDDDLAVLRGWLDGADVVPGLTIDTELRWTVLQSLAANGAATSDQIDAELAGDRTASGEREAALARALLPDAANKAAIWARLTGPENLPNWQHRALLQGFQHPAQVELTKPYRQAYFEVAGRIWASRDSEPAQEFITLAYPLYLVEEETVTATDEWLAGDGHPAPLRRLIAEGRDGVVRALKARATDAAAAG
jgi:aminopeptidase N